MNVSIEYIAGLFDGEGSISLRKRIYNYGYSTKVLASGIKKRYVYNKPTIYWNSYISISNNCLPILEEIKQFFGCGRIHKIGDKNSYDLTWYSHEDMNKVLVQLIPFLCIKKDQANLMMNYIKGREIEEHTLLDDELSLKISSLNKKGRRKINKDQGAVIQ